MADEKTHRQEDAEMQRELDDRMTTDQATERFEFISFCAPFVRVRERATGKLGYLTFDHMPRFYYDWQED